MTRTADIFSSGVSGAMVFDYLTPETHSQSISQSINNNNSIIIKTTRSSAVDVVADRTAYDVRYTMYGINTERCLE